MMAGSWCLGAFEDERGHLPTTVGFFLECSKASEELKIPYSGIPMAIPAFTASLDIICLLLFSIIKGI